MRNEEEVQARFEDLRRKRLSERKQQFLGRCHTNCAHNVRLRVRGNGKCGFCRHPEVIKMTRKNEPFVCDEEGTARRCKYFECRNTPETVEEDFEEILSSPSKCGKSYPKLAILIWFLQDKSRRSRSQRLWSAVGDVFRSLFSLFAVRWW
jgi:hypothetical protein